ncbi:hypothetical protein ACIGXM_12255 [Kitasatospora sp. NPDC052896]|uniref:hypothetical protein n=1 Tax=Kitasatospora sp. NPDC052896 TaxID=3364061 RepID=UPI0037C73F4C
MDEPLRGEQAGGPAQVLPPPGTGAALTTALALLALAALLTGCQAQHRTARIEDGDAPVSATAGLAGPVSGDQPLREDLHRGSVEPSGADPSAPAPVTSPPAGPPPVEPERGPAQQPTGHAAAEAPEPTDPVHARPRPPHGPAAPPRTGGHPAVPPPPVGPAVPGPRPAGPGTPDSRVSPPLGLCGAGEQYGHWAPDSEQARICRGVYGG